MSLIFSALAEIDKQAQGGQADYAAMGTASAPARVRPGVIVIIALVLVVLLCAGVYLFYRSGDEPQRQARTPVASMPAAAELPSDQSPASVVVAETPVAPAPGAAPVDETRVPAAAPTAKTEAEQDPPYAPSRQRVVATEKSSGSMPIRLVGGQTGIEKDLTSARSPVSTPAEKPRVEHPIAPMPHESLQLADESAAVQDEQAADVSEPSTEVAMSAPASEDTEAEEDAPMIGSNNYIKVGTRSEVVADKEVPYWVDRFRQAMAHGDHGKAKAALSKLEAGLSPQSLTLLRMQAWYAVDSGNDSAARSVYSRLLQRLPDDINAGVNLALIDWRAGRQDQALRHINAMYTQHPDSDLVKRNWQVMHQQRR